MSPTRLIPRITPTTTPTPSAIRSVFAVIFFPSESPKAWLCPSRRLSRATTVAGMAGFYLDVLQAGVANFRELRYGEVSRTPLLGTSRGKGYSSEDVRRRLLWNYLGLVDG
jgi:hypothetical protein